MQLKGKRIIPLYFFFYLFFVVPPFSENQINTGFEYYSIITNVIYSRNNIDVLEISINQFFSFFFNLSIKPFKERITNTYVHLL